MRVSSKFLFIRLFPLSLVAVLLSITEVSAQSHSSSISLLNNKAARKVERSVSSNQVESVRGVSSSRDYSLASAFRVETADSILEQSDRSAKIYANYKAAAYLTYVRGAVDVGEMLAYEEEDDAKRVLLLEGLRYSNEYILQPLLGDYYNQIISELRTWRDMTTLSVVQSGNGDIDFSQGSEPKKALLQFRIHASARNGIEPRMTVNDDFKVRLQPLEKKLLFEYSFSF